MDGPAQQKQENSVNILLTGGLGYIGAHTCVQLLQGGHNVIVADNLSNTKRNVIDRIEMVAGLRPVFYEVDVRDAAGLRHVFSSHEFDAVIHFAGLKSVTESVSQSLRYYSNNVAGSLVLFDVMAEFGVKTLVFSSTANVYGETREMPIREDFPVFPTNPYGRGKLIVENVLRDIASLEGGWHVALLRYFNPVGAHPSGLIGEAPSGIPNNLMPFVAKVAAGQLSELQVFGADWPTPDGTGVRDYIHVEDLASGHLAALEYLQRSDGVVTVNLGTGRGYSVLEMISAYERASGCRVPYRIAGRRSGDVAASWTDTSRARDLFGWEARLGIDEMCRDTWNWQSRNPDGY